MEVATQAALIGASAAIITTAAKDIGFPLLVKRQQERKETERIFERYGLPLGQSGQALFWRLNELLYIGGLFLGSHYKLSHFHEYKRVSTYYRLALFLGHLRMLDIEISCLRPKKSKSFTEIKGAVSAIRSTLADGSHAEVKVLGVFSKYLCFTVPGGKSECTALAAQLHDLMCRRFPGELKKGRIDIASMQPDQWYELLGSIQRFFVTKGLIEREIGLDDRSSAQLLDDICIREHYIYRDWQTALGNMMIGRSSQTSGQYTAISFDEFENWLEQDKFKQRWLDRVSALFEDMDVNKPHKDLRVDLLKRLMIDLAVLLTLIHRNVVKRSVVDEATLSRIAEILRVPASAVSDPKTDLQLVRLRRMRLEAEPLCIR